MSGSTWGLQFTVTTWGESHGPALGCVVDGCPAGLPLSEDDIQKDMDRRKPGTSKFVTNRQESDRVKILSGCWEGKTTGTPISMLVTNEDQRSKDYTAIASVYRPGHADYGYDQKYGFRDYRGGGRSSGRETLARVAAGAVAKKMLAEIGITVQAYTLSIGSVTIDRDRFCLAVCEQNPLYMPDALAAEQAADFLAKLEGNSAGGMIECIIKGCPAGIGEPVFRKLDAEIGKAVLSIGAVKGIEFGAGFSAATLLGDENNDPFQAEDGAVRKKTNHAGGILGGLSDGSDIVFRAAVKPTPSIVKEQATVNSRLENCRIQISGRHDPVVVPRAVVVVEAMAAIALADLLLQNMTVRMEHVKRFYGHRDEG